VIEVRVFEARWHVKLQCLLAWDCGIRREVQGLSREFNVILRKEPEGGYSVRCVELPGAISQGETEEEALSNIKEAILLVLEEVERRALCPPENCRKEVVVV